MQEYIDEVKRKSAWKADLRATNAAAAENRPDESEFRKLDSSLKKNTAFIRKLVGLGVAILVPPPPLKVVLACFFFCLVFRKTSRWLRPRP